ncbi:hypothetical protein KIPB_010536, partial [Kipferlia bialata]|eukprot:g10536.t1
MFYVLPPPGGRYQPLPADPHNPRQPQPMTSTVFMTASVPSLVAAVGRGTAVSVNIDNQGKEPITELQWSLTYENSMTFQRGQNRRGVQGIIQGVQGLVQLSDPVLPGTQCDRPIQIQIQPNSECFRNHDHSGIDGYDRLGEYAWEKQFLSLPAQDYRQCTGYNHGEMTKIFKRNTYVEITTNAHGSFDSPLRLPLHWTTTAALDARPTPLQSMSGIMGMQQQQMPQGQTQGQTQ